MKGQLKQDWIDTENTAERRILDLSSIGMRYALTLGRLHYNHASKPLAEQCHKDWLVLVFVLSGKQRYLIHEKEVSVHGGEMLRILPGQRYGTGTWPEQKCDLAWLILKLRPLPRGPALGMSGDGVRSVLSHLSDSSRPQVLPAAADVPGLLDSVFHWWDRREDDLGRETIRNRISALVLGAAAATKGETAAISDRASQQRIERVLQWIAGNDGKEVNITAMARIAGLAPTRFHAHFKQFTGHSPKDWLLRRKVEIAAERLRGEPELTVTRLAHELGFSSSQYFATVFRRYLGMTPGMFRSECELSLPIAQQSPACGDCIRRDVNQA
jgi:AraC-like DNA-binding protein